MSMPVVLAKIRAKAHKWRHMSEASERSVLEHLGPSALAFLLATDTESIQARVADPTAHPLNTQQEQVLAQLVEIDAQLKPWLPESDNAGEWTDRLSMASDPVPDMSLGNLARTISGGALLTVDTTQGKLEQLLTKLAIDCYPGLLVKEPDGPLGFPRSLSRAMWQNPALQAFQDLARNDPDLGKLFTDENEHSGPVGSVLRSTGSGGGIQLWGLAESLINAGWIAATVIDQHPNVEDFVAAVVKNLEAVRAAINGRPARIPARVGLAGVLLPQSASDMNLGWARLRRSDERDKPYFRTSGKSEQLTGTNERGETAVINYHGDLVLELDVPYRLAVRDLNIPEPWPEALLVSARTVESAVEDLRLGLLLAISDRRTVIHLSWQTFVDPLSGHRMLGWNDRTQAVGLMPTKLKTAELRKWIEWTQLIHQHRTPSIAVAVRRMLASVAERRTMEDILVDAVIVWENLFGAKTETTLRVCSSLAWLLGTSAADRKVRFARYKKIYGFRSAVVHGAASIRQQELQEYALEAVEISMDALRAIFKKRSDLLGLPSSEERSIEMMHGVKPPRSMSE